MKNLKKITLLFIGLAFTLSSFAQGQRRGGGAGANAHVFGKVQDFAGENVGYASVIILQTVIDPATDQKKEVLVTGVTTEDNGEFSIENVAKQANLKIQVSFLGYVNFEQDLAFSSRSSEYDLGKIVLLEDAQALDEITITAAISTMKMDIDKRIFNVGADAISVGGTGEDVLKNVPGVNVDIDGNITMRSAAPQIFLDGRPTTLTPDQIPADAIETIEIITNPSAKYDASGGGAGILNIILKKNKKTGYNGSIRAGANHLGAVNLGTNLNVRQNKINFFTSLNGRLNKRTGTNDLTRTNLIDGNPVLSTRQTGTNKQGGGFGFARAGFDYLMTNKTSFSLSGLSMYGEFNPTTVQNINIDDLTDDELAAYSQRNSTAMRSFKNQGLVFGFKHLFSTEGDEITFDANYYKRRFTNNSDFITDYYQNGLGSGIENSIGQRVIGDSGNSSLVLQSDLVKNLTSKMKMEAGVRLRINDRETINNNYTINQETNELVEIPNIASNFVNTDNVYAAYTTISSKYKGFGYKVGLRAESSSYKGEITKTKEKFSNSFPISLFPSVFLSQKLGDKDDIQLSYTRRVRRPNFFQLIPFADSTDRLNVRMGNPDLKPQFTTSVEASYMKRLAKGNSLLSSVYYKHSDDLLSNYLFEDDNGTLISTFINANSSYSAGMELTAQTYLTEWMNLTTNVNLYNSKINLEDVETDALWSWFGKVNGNVKMKKNFSLQLTGSYQSRANQAAGGNSRRGFGRGAQSSAQGYIKSFYSVDLAVKKSFLKNKLTATLSMNDIFRTRFSSSYSSNEFFTQEYTRINNPQVLRLNLSYNFGKIDTVLFKRRSKGTGESLDQ